MALSDWTAIKKLSPEEDKGVIIYHIQQFVEKLLKGLITSLGYEPPKTHFPSRFIDRLLGDYELGEIDLDLSKEEVDILERIISIAKVVEDEGVKPRYGVHHHNRIILPNELYSTDQIKMFLEDAKFIAESIKQFFKKRNICSEDPKLCEVLDEL